MNLLKKIGIILRLEENKKTEKISCTDLSDIDSLLRKKSNEISGVLGKNKDAFLNKVSTFLRNLEEDSKNLDLLDIDKIRADEKLKMVTKQGKDEYLVALKKFIENLMGFVSKNKEYEAGKINDELGEFSKGSFKSFHRTTILIGKEMTKIKDNIIKIRKLEDEFIENNSELIKEREDIDNLMQKNEEKKNKEELRDKIIVSKNKSEQVCEEGLLELDAIKKNINEVKESSQYLERKRLVEEKNKNEDALKEAEIKVGALFDRRALEKYTHLDLDKKNKKIASTYVENPIKALLSDSEFGILMVRDDMREKIENGLIVLRNIDKTLGKINKDDKVFFEHRSNLLHLNEKIKRFDENLKNIGGGFEDLLEKKLRIEKEIEDHKNQIGVFNKKLEGVNIILLELDAKLKEGIANL